MLLTDARRDARITAAGELVPLEEQDRALWKADQIEEGTRLRHAPTPIVELNAAVALGMAAGLQPAIDWVERIERGGELARYHLLAAAKADLLRRIGKPADAAVAYRDAIALASNPAEQRYLARRMAECGAATSPSGS